MTARPNKLTTDGQYRGGLLSHLSIRAQGMKAVLLVGGRGTRLRSVVSSTPKPLARLGTCSLLELLIRQLRYQGIEHIVMCTGYLADQIEREFGDGHRLNVVIEYSKEQTPLGTAGAVKLAEAHLRDVSEFLVLNGDSFLEIDFCELVHFHREHGGLVSLAVRQVANAARYGTVHVNEERRVMSFAEKVGVSTPGLVNAGVCVFSCEILPLIPSGPGSLETDVYPHLLEYGMYASEQNGIFVDIGTPEDYARAQQFVNRIYEATFRTRRLDRYPNHTDIDKS